MFVTTINYIISYQWVFGRSNRDLPSVTEQEGVVGGFDSVLLSPARRKFTLLELVCPTRNVLWQKIHAKDTCHRSHLSPKCQAKQT